MDVPFPWCLDCFKKHGHRTTRALSRRLRRYHLATRADYATDPPDTTAYKEAADAIDALLVTLGACGLALRQTDVNTADMISEILKEWEL